LPIAAAGPGRGYRGEASAAVQLCPRLALRLEVGQASRARWVFTMFSLLNRILVM